MTSSLEEELKTLLDGGSLPVPDTYDVASEKPRPLRLRYSVCYIVMGVLLNEQDEVLMMQEAKSECWGSWYLPAGRLERGETLVEGLCREVKEETGLLCEPLTLLAVEERGAAWVRFVFLAKETGGSLKSPASADSESLQASWWDKVSPLPLRCKDILPIIQLALGYQRFPVHPSILPMVAPTPYLVLRLVLLCLCPGGEMWILQSSTELPHLPLVLCTQHRRSILASLQYFLRDPPQSCGLLGVQHQGGDGADGVCFNIMGGIEVSEPPPITTERLCWTLVENEDLKQRLKHTLRENKLLPLYS
ncbi:8-oxo-dGDP phosphatase NUDT18 [Bombina bombina]|uniref:8-oxo-dGDP phosphatase NUDT18 n=1 Tax=Bombina bombina TaxID=8345 RepID=UPI00235A6833|nr:8-oxo-dGDP phosphatase NUDT18 [Bombina bombina]